MLTEMKSSFILVTFCTQNDYVQRIDLIIMHHSVLNGDSHQLFKKGKGWCTFPSKGQSIYQVVALIKDMTLHSKLQCTSKIQSMSMELIPWLRQLPPGQSKLVLSPRSSFNLTSCTGKGGGVFPKMRTPPSIRTLYTLHTIQDLDLFTSPSIIINESTF